MSGKKFCGIDPMHSVVSPVPYHGILESAATNKHHIKLIQTDKIVRSSDIVCDFDEKVYADLYTNDRNATFSCIDGFI